MAMKLVLNEINYNEINGCEINYNEINGNKISTK